MSLFGTNCLKMSIPHPTETYFLIKKITVLNVVNVPGADNRKTKGVRDLQRCYTAAA